MIAISKVPVEILPRKKQTRGGLFEVDSCQKIYSAKEKQKHSQLLNFRRYTTSIVSFELQAQLRYSYRTMASFDTHYRPSGATSHSPLTTPRSRPRSQQSSYASLVFTNRAPNRDFHSQPPFSNNRRPYHPPFQPTRDSAQFQIDMACRWWNDFLKPTPRRKGWLQFRPPQCMDWGFIPEQYVKDVVDPSSSNDCSLLINHVLRHGIRGVHYAIGWQELYQLLRRFGRIDDRQQRKNDTAFTKINYKGPTLPFLETLQQAKGPPKPNVAAPVEKSNVEPESEQAKEELRNRMVMIGFWESRRRCLPSLYDEKFPNGMENAAL